MPKLRDILARPDLRRLYAVRDEIARLSKEGRIPDEGAQHAHLRRGDAVATGGSRAHGANEDRGGARSHSLGDAPTWRAGREPLAGPRIVRKDVSFAVRIVKVDEAKRLIYGIVYEPLVEDTHGNWATAEDIENAAHVYLADHRGLNVMHSVALHEDEARVVESYIAPAEIQLGTQRIQAGTWVLVAKVFDDEIWSAVQDGTLNGWSMEGWAEIVVDEPVPTMKESTMKTNHARCERLALAKGEKVAELLNTKIESVLADRAIDREALLLELVENFPAAGELEAVSAILDGSAEPSQEQLEAFATALEIPIEELEAAAKEDTAASGDGEESAEDEEEPPAEKKHAMAKGETAQPVPGRMKNIVIPVVSLVDRGANRKDWALTKSAAAPSVSLRDLFKRTALAYARLEKALVDEKGVEDAAQAVDQAVLDLARARGISVAKDDSFLTLGPSLAKETWTRLMATHDALGELGSASAVSREDGSMSLSSSAVRRARAALIALLEVLPDEGAPEQEAEAPEAEGATQDTEEAEPETVAKGEPPISVEDWLRS